MGCPFYLFIITASKKAQTTKKTSDFLSFTLKSVVYKNVTLDNKSVPCLLTHLL